MHGRATCASCRIVSNEPPSSRRATPSTRRTFTSRPSPLTPSRTTLADLDLSGSLGRCHRPRDRRDRTARHPPVAARVEWRCRPCRRSPAAALPGAGREDARARRLLRLRNPDGPQGRLDLHSSRTSVSIVVAPIPVAATKWSVPATTFLSCDSGGHHRPERQVGDRRQRTEPADQPRRRAARPPRRCTPRRHAEGQRRQHAVADRLPVPETPVARDRLQRMADRVAEIQDAPEAGLVLVGRHHGGLDAARFGDDGGSGAADRGRTVAAATRRRGRTGARWR